MPGVYGLIRYYVAVASQVHEVCMPGGYPRLGLMACTARRHADVELVGSVVFQPDAYPSTGNEALAALHGVAVTVAQHLQFQFRAAYQRAQGHGYGQSGHARAGYAYSHRVLQYVGA